MEDVLRTYAVRPLWTTTTTTSMIALSQINILSFVVVVEEEAVLCLM